MLKQWPDRRWPDRPEFFDYVLKYLKIHHFSRSIHRRAAPHPIHISLENDGFFIVLSFIYTLFSQSLFGVWSLFGTILALSILFFLLFFLFLSCRFIVSFVMGGVAITDSMRKGPFGLGVEHLGGLAVILQIS